MVRNKKYNLLNHTTIKDKSTNFFLFTSISTYLRTQRRHISRKTSVEKSLAQMKDVKNARNEPSLTLMCQMVLEISHFKVRNLSKMDVAIL